MPGEFSYRGKSQTEIDEMLLVFQAGGYDRLVTENVRMRRMLSQIEQCALSSLNTGRTWMIADRIECMETGLKDIIKLCEEAEKG